MWCWGKDANNNAVKDSGNGVSNGVCSCFWAFSQALLHNGSSAPLHLLEPGALVQALAANGSLVWSPMYTDTHLDTARVTRFVRLAVAQSSAITLTPTHHSIVEQDRITRETLFSH